MGNLQAAEEEHFTEGEFPGPFWKPELDTSRDRLEFFGMGSCMFQLQQSCTPKSLRVVGQIHHDHVCSIGFWIGVFPGRDILWYCIPWLDGQFQMVGY